MFNLRKSISRVKDLVGIQRFLWQRPELRNPQLHLHPPGEFISDNIRASNRYYELDLLVWCAGRFDFSSYVDVGANIGNHVSFFSRLGAECLAFEPSEENFTLLKKNAPGAQVFQCAIAESNGTERFVTYSSCMGNSNLISSFSGEIQPWGDNAQVCEVVTKTLDSFDLKHATFIKIDVEGAELRVLRGARETLARLKPAIWIEMHRDEDLKKGGFPYSRADIFCFLQEMGYRLIRGDESDTNLFFTI